MADFLGKTVLVTLKSGRVIQGSVGNVIQDAALPQLTLNNALFRDSGHVFPTWNVVGSEIADLVFVAPEAYAEPKVATTQQHATAAPAAGVAPPHDPAIVSFAKTTEAPTKTIAPTPVVPLDTKTSQQAARRTPGSIRSPVDDAARLKGPFTATLETHSKSKATQKASYSGKLKENLNTKPAVPQYQILKREPKPKLDVATISLPQGDEEIVTAVAVKTVAPTHAADSSPRRARKAKNSSSQGQLLAAGNPSFRGKGWRQDPMLTEAYSKEEGKSMKVKKLGKARQRKGRQDDLTGWATEDATDIQDMGEFDFEANLANFDKATVFAQLKREDDIPAEERLVNHNKLKVRARPGTFGGTKLHPTENVLDVPSPAFLSMSRRSSARQRSPSSASTSDAADGSRNGLKTSGHLKQRRFPTRGSSTNLVQVERSQTDPITSARLDSSLHSLKRPSQPASSTSNGHLPRMTPSESEGLANDRLNGSAGAVNFCLENGKSMCPVITPGGMTALEDLARSEHRLKHHIINENAGRTLSEIIVDGVLSDDVELSRAPTAIFLVGNHRAGARALVAARHLMARGFSPVCCVLGLDRPGSQLDHEAERQISMIRHATDAVVANWREVQKYLSVNEGHGRFADVWIDALVAPGHSYDTLVPEDQSAVREMVSWANRRLPSHNPRTIYSIDVPCGINASTGESTVTGRNSRIQLRSNNIVCMGAPRTGLLSALRNAWTVFQANQANGVQSSAQIEALLACTIHVVDIGVNEVWKAYGQQLGLATGHGVEFGLKWYMTLRLNQESNEDETWQTE